MLYVMYFNLLFLLEIATQVNSIAVNSITYASWQLKVNLKISVGSLMKRMRD